VFRVLLTPLVGIVHVAGVAFMTLGWAEDIASIVAFALSAMLSIAAYIIVPVLTVRTVLKRRRRKA